MPHAKFRADLLKTVAVHKEQRNTDTDTHTDIPLRYSLHTVLWPATTLYPSDE